MALNAYLELESVDGKIEGGCTQAGREGLIEVHGFSHEVVSPRDAASGLPSGKRQHKALTFTKHIDQATPLLMDVLCHNKNLPNFRLDFYRPSRAGKEEGMFSITLHDGSIAGIRSEQLNNKYTENMNKEPREHVSVCYREIIWDWHIGGAKSASDNWEAPQV